MEYSSRPHAVTVYRSGARVERRVRVPGRAGPLVLPGLPLALDDGSVSVGVVDGDDGVRVGSTRVRLHARPRADAPEAPDAEALRLAREALHRARRVRAQRRMELGLLEGIPMPSRPRPVEGQPPPPSPLQARLAFDAFVDGETRARHEELATLEQEIRGLERQVATLEDRWRRHESAHAARPEELSKSVHLELQADAPADRLVTLTLTYRVPACRWVPRYALRLDGDRARIELRAAVAQASGESWEGVELTLSTAQPLAYSPLPELPAARIGKVQPRPPARRPRPAPEGAEALFADVDRALSTLSAPPRPRRRRTASLVTTSWEELLEQHDVVEMAEEAEESGDNAAFGEVRSRGSAPAFAALSEAPSPEPAAAPAPRRAKMRKSKRAAPMPEGARQEEESADEAIAPWPDYRTLALPDPYRPGRGQLVRVSPDDTLASSITAAGLSVPFDVRALLGTHRTRAEAVAQLPLPAGARPLRSSHFDHAVRASHPVDVPSAGGWHTVSLGESEGPCRLRYVGVPREEPALYRILAMANPCDHPLLPGPVEVYVDDSYVLTAHLPTTGSGEELELGVGVEPALHVARNTRFEEARSDERVVAMRELHHHVVIDVRNDLPHTVDVEVRERVPIPDGEAEVAIDVVDAEPAWAPYDQRERGALVEGGHRWQVQVEPRSSRTLGAHYVVRLYANHELVGGDRRES